MWLARGGRFEPKLAKSDSNNNFNEINTLKKRHHQRSEKMRFVGFVCYSEGCGQKRNQNEQYVKLHEIKIILK